MTKPEQHAFRETLETLQSDLENGIRHREALAINTSAEDLDRIQLASDRDYAMRILERNSNRLREVQGALRRMAKGAFGVCVDCEEDINAKRLAAVPWTSLCIVCQEAADQQQADPGNDAEEPFVQAA